MQYAVVECPDWYLATWENVLSTHATRKEADKEVKRLRTQYPAYQEYYHVYEVKGLLENEQ